MAGWMKWLTGAGMALVAHVLAHNLVFLATYGPRYGQALVETGHDTAWTTAFIVALGLGLALLVAGTWQLRRLSRQARSVRAAAGPRDPGPSAFAAHLGRLWRGLLPATALLFVLQENAEHLAVGDGLPGLGVLARGGSPLALTVIGAVTFGVALVGALYRWRRDTLVARISTGHGPWRRPTVKPQRPRGTDRRAPLALGGSVAGRAPPLGSRA
jgi:hypothetical protein